MTNVSSNYITQPYDQDKLHLQSPYVPSYNPISKNEIHRVREIEIKYTNYNENSMSFKSTKHTSILFLSIGYCSFSLCTFLYVKIQYRMYVETRRKQNEINKIDNFSSKTEEII